MAVSKMRLVKVIGEYGCLERVIEICAESGNYHPEHATEVLRDLGRFMRIADSNPYTETMHELKEIFAALGSEPSIDVVEEELDSSEAVAYVRSIKEKISSIQERKNGTKNGIEYVKRTLEQLEHFKGLDIHLSKIFESEFIKVRFGKLPIESYKKLDQYEDNPYIMFFPISSDQSYHWGIYVVPTGASEEADRVFSSLLFQRMRVSSAATTPLHAIEILEKQHTQALAELKKLEDQAAEIVASDLKKLSGIYAFFKKKHDTYELRKYCVRYKNSFIQVGWVPSGELKKLCEKLDTVAGIRYTTEAPSTESGRTIPPTKLKNPRLFRPFEYYVNMYGSPAYNEFDPTVFVAITYTIFYGIMFADVGQGLVLALIGWLMYRFKGMEIGRILVPCGISGAVFGAVFGSVFGFEYALNPIYLALGWHEKPIEVMQSAMLLLMLSIALGVVLIVVAMAINIVISFKQKRYGRAIFSTNGICGMSVFVGILTIAMASYLELSGFPTVLIAVVFVAVPMLALLFSLPLSNLVDRRHKEELESFGEYMLESFFELFESLLSYVTNAVSFMRVGAFVLVHAGMMLVFFSIAELVGGGFSGAVVIIFGNILVIVLEGLLVGVQALRLEFYEMFSRFFEGNGRDFKPIDLKTQTNK